MTASCSCDYGDPPDLMHFKRIRARKQHRCYECHTAITPGETYERTVSLYDGDWDVARVCCRCLAVRDYIEAHAPCFCWLYGSMLDDARNTIEEHGHHSAGFYIGAMKRVLRAERHAALGTDRSEEPKCL